ncbi:glutamyl-tRNA reductase [Deltaproteobacteria bacterium Smac51]|nr:glutamyl-tRNA reductase [Deltaproteobacteria bacterium Smac51]
MEFLIIGVSHHQTPVAVREKFASMEETERLVCKSGPEGGTIRESLVLSTCNRLEILAVSPQPDEAGREILESLSTVSGLAIDEFLPYINEYRNIEAARHLFRVASSLDSLVLGEPQILGQVKEAFRQSLREGRAGIIINKLMHKCFRAAKRVRSETSLAGGAVSVASAAVSLARALGGGSLSDSSVLLLGAGPMAALAAAHLRRRTPAALTIMNRGLEKAKTLAAKHGAQARPWDELSPAVLEADLIIAATGASSPVLSFETIGKTLALRGPRPLYIIDIGVPRNASHDLKKLDNVILRNIDDLNEVVWESRAARQEAAMRAEGIIDEEVEKFSQWLKSLSARPTVSALTRKAERIRRMELARTLSQHDFDDSQKAALEAMTGALVRRLLHDPLAFIKDATGAGAAECLRPDGPCDHSGDCSPGRDRLATIRRAFKIEPEDGQFCG